MQRRSDPAHGRIQQIHLTSVGQGLVAACRTEVDSLQHQMLAELAPAEIETLTSLLTRCLSGLGANAADR